MDQAGQAGVVAAVLLLIVVAFVLFLVIEYFLSHPTPPPLDPYLKTPLWPAWLIPREGKEQIYLFLQNLRQFDNRPFYSKNALFCRESGRICPNTINWWGSSKIGWFFLQKRRPGRWVQWSSLSDLQREAITRKHVSLEHFQTKVICQEGPAPGDVSEEAARLKPGPLYVDVDTFVLMGWVVVPSTLFEVLVVQFPIASNHGLPST